MTREDLIKFNISQQWRKARISFYEEQIKTINKLVSVLSDMPKGSRIVYDNEAEKLSKLVDQIRELENQIENDAMEEENKILNELKKLEPKYGLILYNYYLLGKSIKYIAKEVIFNEVKYTYILKDRALEEFDKLDKENIKIHEKKG